MVVKIAQATENPLKVISDAAGMCYGKTTMTSDEDVSISRIVTCYKAKHMSVFEHASVTFHIFRISRACSHQLVRHRLASYSQRSQRYCKELENSCWYVTPFDISVDEEAEKVYEEAMANAKQSYLKLLDMGLKPEDARYVLPEAHYTDITVTMNCRELYHFFDLRTGHGAQQEIKDLAGEMMLMLYGRGDWAYLMELYNEGAIIYRG